MSTYDSSSSIRFEVQKLVDLPPLSLVAQRLIAQLSDEHADIDQIAATIELDPALAARIVGVAQSAFFGSRRAIYKVRDAIIRVLGLDMVRSLALSISLGDGFQVESRVGFDTHGFWTTALLSADMSRYVAPRIRTPDAPTPDSAYLCGLLHNLGLLPLIHLYPAEMKRVLETAAGAPEWSLAVPERQELGVDHHEAGAWLAHRWHLPSEAVVVIENHHNLAYRGPEWPVNLLVGATSRWAQWRLRNEGVAPEVGPALTVLGLTDRELGTVQETFERKREQTAEMADFLSKGGK